MVSKLNPEIPGTLLMALTPSAPPRMAAAAMSQIYDVMEASFAMTGLSVAERTHFCNHLRRCGIFADGSASACRVESVGTGEVQFKTVNAGLCEHLCSLHPIVLIAVGCSHNGCEGWAGPGILS